jgi:hypothetical protein
MCRDPKTLSAALKPKSSRALGETLNNCKTPIDQGSEETEALQRALHSSAARHEHLDIKMPS